MIEYVWNCFLLLIPILAWNILFAKSLPKGYERNFFWKDIPAIIGTVENVMRIVVFLLPLMMVLSLDSIIQKVGLMMYIIGLAVYFSSWIFQIYYPQRLWSKSMLGFMAPAYTTIIWFVGIGLIGETNFLKIPYISVAYIGAATVFVLVHTIHTFIVFKRL
jgi:hypothetical protein